jgi:hypothetical protein
MSVWFSVGLVGFGASAGLFPELRLGVLAIGWCRGSIAENMRFFAGRLRTAMQALGVRT